MPTTPGAVRLRSPRDASGCDRFEVIHALSYLATKVADPGPPLAVSRGSSGAAEMAAPSSQLSRKLVRQERRVVAHQVWPVPRLDRAFSPTIESVQRAVRC